MSIKFLGIIDDTIQFKELGELTTYRTVGAIPFGGHYRLIDFPLSCFQQANVRNVAIFSSGKFRSLQDHIGNGEIWDLNRKRDGLFFFPKMSDKPSVMLSFYHIHDHIEYLLKSHEDYVVITNSYVVSLLDYKQLVKEHARMNVDISELYYQDERLNIFILSRKLLIELVLEGINFGYNNIIQVIDLSNRYHIGKIHLDKEILLLKSVNDYFKAHMRLLEPTIFNRLFVKNKPIITKINDAPSTYYKRGAKTFNSILSNGIISEGLVENSIVFDSVIIGKNTHINNSIINEKCIIGSGSLLENVILDKECIIAPNVCIKGEINHPVMFSKYTKIAKYNL
ncbi:glucose-1-phosphate adenylyltransferase [Mycoplasmatota bacterium]|nr:glucose-1-phosphate adenylyltransferase [Mycoplasmatota bacterium]